jgi:mitogen-activated protein kinase 1/3
VKWYAAPEMILSGLDYSLLTEAVDMWAVGCIIAEIIQRKPFFISNGTTSDQLRSICRLLGYNCGMELGFDADRRARAYLDRACVFPPQSAYDILPQGSIEVKEFILELVRIDRNQRLTANEALSHPYLADEWLSYYDVDDQDFYQPTEKFFEYENRYLTSQNLCDMIREEVVRREELDLDLLNINIAFGPHCLK